MVEPDAGGEREELDGDPGAEAVGGEGLVALEPEPVFKGLEDRLDALPPLRSRGTANQPWSDIPIMWTFFSTPATANWR